MYLNICAAYLRKHVQIRIPSCNQNRHNRFKSNFLMEAAKLHILLQSEQNVGERQKDRQKNKDEDTNAQIMFVKNLWCLTQTPQILKNLWCLAQTPQIFVKFHRF